MRLFDMDSREDYLLDGKYKVATPYAPCVDVVEVVRCKDCAYWASAEDYDCEIHSGAFGADDFCSYGERRGDGEE